LSTSCTRTERRNESRCLTLTRTNRTARLSVADMAPSSLLYDGPLSVYIYIYIYIYISVIAAVSVVSLTTTRSIIVGGGVFRTMCAWILWYLLIDCITIIRSYKNTERLVI
jgi:uncharacterized membrane protein (DUF106 family)